MLKKNQITNLLFSQSRCENIVGLSIACNAFQIIPRFVGSNGAKKRAYALFIISFAPVEFAIQQTPTSQSSSIKIPAKVLVLTGIFHIRMLLSNKKRGTSLVIFFTQKFFG